MLMRAGIDIAKANKSIRIPLNPLTNLKTRPILASLTTLNIVGENDKYFLLNSSKMIPIFFFLNKYQTNFNLNKLKKIKNLILIKL